MSFDGFVTRSVVRELNYKLIGGKVDKIYQPDNDEINITVRTYNGNYKLLLSANASNARVHLTNEKRENPMSPPMLCMLMRKHLTGGKIVSISQINFDRVIKIDIEAYNELGDLSIKSVIAEIMGRHSNIIFIDENNKILDSAKHIDFTVSAQRQILPGFIYELPPSQGKISPLKFDMVSFLNQFEAQGDDVLLDKFILGSILGFSPLLAREVVYRFCGHTKAVKSEVDSARFVAHLNGFIQDMIAYKYSPCVTLEYKTKRPMSFSCVRLTQYESSAEIAAGESISDVIERFYYIRSLQERMRQKSAGILKLVQNNIDRCTKKIVLHRENLEKCKHKDKYKIEGDLLTANMYRVNYGMEQITVQNYYDNNCEQTIKLDPAISPAQNAQRLYKKYNKAKVTETYAREQIKNAEDELEYLDTVLESIQKAETTKELSEIKEELREQGYLPKTPYSKKKHNVKSQPMKFLSTDGYEILVGKNNKQNDELTIKMSFSTDIWMHTKNIPGSHVLIRTGGTGTASDTALTEGAQLAAYYSKARSSSQVPVDYTLVKNIKKPNGAKPGFVIYESNRTLYVTPKLPDGSE